MCENILSHNQHGCLCLKNDVLIASAAKNLMDFFKHVITSCDNSTGAKSNFFIASESLFLLFIYVLVCLEETNRV